jgi:hypothetical protein
MENKPNQPEPAQQTNVKRPIAKCGDVISCKNDKSFKGVVELVTEQTYIGKDGSEKKAFLYLTRKVLKRGFRLKQIKQEDVKAINSVLVV